MRSKGSEVRPLRERPEGAPLSRKRIRNKRPTEHKVRADLNSSNHKFADDQSCYNITIMSTSDTDSKERPDSLSLSSLGDKFDGNHLQATATQTLSATSSKCSLELNGQRSASPHGSSCSANNDMRRASSCLYDRQSTLNCSKDGGAQTRRTSKSVKLQMEPMFLEPLEFDDVLLPSLMLTRHDYATSKCTSRKWMTMDMFTCLRLSWS